MNYSDPFSEPPKRPSWVTSPDIKPEPGYNPYRDDFSLFKEIYRENPSAFKGSTPLPDESEFQYYSRRNSEYNYANQTAKKKLTESSGFSALLVLIYVILSLGVQITVSLVLGTFAPTMTEEAYFELIDIVNYILMAIQYLFFFPVVFFVGCVGRKNKLKTFFQKPAVSGAYTFRWCIISLGVTYIVAMIFDAIFNFLSQLGMNVNDLSSELPTEPLDLALYGLFVVICAPLFEELFFRGIMLTHLQKYGCVFASVVSGVFFGLIHQNHSQMFFATALGIVFAFMDIRAGSIIPSILAHMVVNGYNFLSTLVAAPTNYNEVVFGDGSVTELTGPIWAVFTMGLLNILIYVAMAAAIVLLIIEVVKYPQSFKLPAGDSTLTSGEKSRAFFSSPVVIITLIILAIVIYTNSFLPIDAISNLVDSLAESA